MRIIGVEFASSNMNYVGIEDNGKTWVIVTSNRIILGDTRDRDALVKKIICKWGNILQPNKFHYSLFSWPDHSA